ncbi:hypothetical protein GCM10027064_17380 [Microbacterium petrolearium]|jgi:putative lipoic acid-binding regulatory protein
MALDTMLAAEIEQQLKTMGRKERAQFTLDLVEVVHRYATSDAVGEERVSDDEGLGAVVAAARTHLEQTEADATE